MMEWLKTALSILIAGIIVGVALNTFIQGGIGLYIATPYHAGMTLHELQSYCKGVENDSVNTCVGYYLSEPYGDKRFGAVTGQLFSAQAGRGKYASYDYYTNGCSSTKECQDMLGRPIDIGSWSKSQMVIPAVIERVACVPEVEDPPRMIGVSTGGDVQAYFLESWAPRINSGYHDGYFVGAAGSGFSQTMNYGSAGQVQAQMVSGHNKRYLTLLINGQVIGWSMNTNSPATIKNPESLTKWQEYPWYSGTKLTVYKVKQGRCKYFYKSTEQCVTVN